MKATPTRYPRGTRGPTESYGTRTTLAGTVAVSVAIVLGTLAVLYPVAGLVGGATAVATGLIARAVVRVLRRRGRGRSGRQYESRPRRVCLPSTDVCVEL